MNELTDEQLQGARNAKKETQKKSNTAQLPIYRDCSNLLFIVMRTMYHAPRKMTKPLDEAVDCATELLRSVALANEVRGAGRVSSLNIAIANANALNTMIGALAFLGVLSKAESRDFKKRLGRVIAQCIGWRESATRQGRSLLPKGGEE